MQFPSLMSTFLLSCLLFINMPLLANSDAIFAKQQFTDRDAVLVVREDGEVIYAWQAKKPLVPASLAKLITSYLAIQKWGLQHRFSTEFYQRGSELWVKGYGDPTLISEELDKIVIQLASRFDIAGIASVHLDSSYFETEAVPGSSSVTDPYNAPLSALAANFNTVNLQFSEGRIDSAESQTPLTATALKLAKMNQTELEKAKKLRVNLINSDNAQLNFAELLTLKLGLAKPSVSINQQLPQDAKLVYRHSNSQTLETVLVGAMKYSNNFIANQVFLKLAENPSARGVNFSAAQEYVDNVLRAKFSWQSAELIEGAGLSRQNKLTAEQLDTILLQLKPHQTILKEVDLKLPSQNQSSVSNAYAKTGTLNGVRNYAGYINLPKQEYRFVFLFNRATNYGYRESLLKLLAQQLIELEKN